MNPLASWPALHGELPPFTEVQRSVWGKVHGAPSDFRWIARSAGFARDRADLPVQLNLGGEDAPARFTAWRVLGDCCYAVTGYPSRAIDAAGRRGFLEKQVLEWRRPAHVPAALGALLLLPRVAALTEDVWWEKRGGEFWMNPEALLALDPEDLAFDEDAIGIAIERGRQQLRDTLPPEGLARLYDQLLSSRRPALLTGVQQPLSAEGLAALLLPLPREIADRISLAGWIPSERPSTAELNKRWDVLAVTQAAAVAFDPATEAPARRMAETLLNFDASATAPVAKEPSTSAPPPDLPEIALPSGQLEKPGTQLELKAPSSNAPAILHELHAFASSADRRWLTPQSLKFNGKLDVAYASLLASWTEELRKQKPEWVHVEQWSAKIDVLRSAAIVLLPHASILQTIGIPNEGSRVPALLFASQLDDRQADSLTSLEETGLRRVLTQSARCAAPKSVWDPIHQWLQRWRPRHSRFNVGALITEALRLRAH